MHKMVIPISGAAVAAYIACGVYVGHVDRKHTWTPGLTAVHSDGHVARVAHTWAWMKRDLGPTTRGDLRRYAQDVLHKDFGEHSLLADTWLKPRSSGTAPDLELGLELEPKLEPNPTTTWLPGCIFARGLSSAGELFAAKHCLTGHGS
jgi:hypothetical protein